MKNQSAMVLDYIMKYGSITPLEAMKDLGCMRLGARIYDLRHEGVDIIKTDVTTVNRFGKPIRFARYSIKMREENEDEQGNTNGAANC